MPAIQISGAPCGLASNKSGPLPGQRSTVAAAPAPAIHSSRPLPGRRAMVVGRSLVCDPQLAAAPGPAIRNSGPVWIRDSRWRAAPVPAIQSSRPLPARDPLLPAAFKPAIHSNRPLQRARSTVAGRRLVRDPWRPPPKHINGDCDPLQDSRSIICRDGGGGCRSRPRDQQ